MLRYFYIDVNKLAYINFVKHFTGIIGLLGTTILRGELVFRNMLYITSMYSHVIVLAIPSKADRFLRDAWYRVD